MKKTTKKIVLISSIIATALIVTHFINKFIFYITTCKEHLFSPHSHHYTWRFGKIYYTKKGKGPALLLVHDLDNTSSHYEWLAMVDKLAENHTVYTIDLIGCGYSEKPKFIYTNYLYVQLLSDFIKDVIGESTSIVCSRNSCSVGVMTSYIHSELINHIVLINPRDTITTSTYPSRKHKFLRAILNTPIIGTLIYNIKNSRYQLYKTFNNDYLSSRKSVRKYVKAYSEAAHTSGSSSLYVYSSIRCHYTSASIMHALTGLTNPITILEGSDCGNAQHIIKEYESLNPNVKSVLLPNAKELPQIEHPDQIISLINTYTR